LTNITAARQAIYFAIQVADPSRVTGEHRKAQGLEGALLVVTELAATSGRSRACLQFTSR
jgi:hypothetical protein